jgi:hypothetical protein
MGGCLSQASQSTSPSPPPVPTTRPSAAANPRPRAPAAPRQASGTALTSLSSRDKGKGKAKPGTSSQSEPIQMSRLDKLRTYATLPKPSSSLPPTTLLLSTPHTIAIFDAYPKAKYHFLVLPRYPFPPRSDPREKTSIARLSEFDDLKSLLLKTSGDAREQVIGALAEAAGEVEEMIRDEMVKTEGFEWGIDIGFHAIPSMK